MSFESKRRLVGIALLAIAVWPPIHRGLVHFYDINPWRFFGWAMYCTPKLGVTVGVVPYENGEPSGRELSSEIRRARLEYGRSRLAYGLGSRPARLAATVFSEIDSADSVVIVVEKLYLDLHSAEIRGRRDYFRYSSTPEGVRGGLFETTTVGATPGPA